MKVLVKVLIPVYKTPDADELNSLRQGLSVLKRYPIVIVTYQNLDIQNYVILLENAGVDFSFEYFDESFFKSVGAYSRLLLSRHFYERFAATEYIFIYQLDGYVFRDELEEWCNKGFDYIGAPWFKHYGAHQKQHDFYKVGNGGISLRKTTTFLNVFDQRLPLSVFGFYVRNIRRKEFLKMLIHLLKMLFLLLFTRRTVEYYLKNVTDERINEDCFWADGLSGSSLALKVPDFLLAAEFCFEQSPEYLYHLIGEKLPFACHAYKKYEYESFWKKCNIFQ